MDGRTTEELISRQTFANNITTVAHYTTSHATGLHKKQKIEIFLSYKRLHGDIPTAQFPIQHLLSGLIMRTHFALPACLLLTILPYLVKGLCSSDRLLQYQVTLKTHWSEESFPKDYPKFRPPAQWSKLVGRSHGGNFSIFRVGGFASAGLKKFAETGSPDLLDEIAQGTTGIFDSFTAPGIPKGVGEASTNFFADAGHSKVSLVARIIPSPDWFIGIDGLDLCLNGQEEWIKSLSVQVDALDAGTDNGYTYTAPHWPSVPQEAVYQITPQNPSHPAGSFYYPDRDRHTPLATFTFVKLKEYSLWSNPTEESLPEEIDANDWGNELNPPNEQEYSELTQTKPTKKRRFRKSKGRDCVVSKWTEWSDCTSKTCDVAEQYRTRSIISHPRSGGVACLPLVEKRLCMPDRDCRQNYFDWRSQQK